MGARLAEAVCLDLNGLPTTPRRRRLHTRGEGRRGRSVAVHPELVTAVDAWLDVRTHRARTGANCPAAEAWPRW